MVISRETCIMKSSKCDGCDLRSASTLGDSSWYQSSDFSGGSHTEWLEGGIILHFELDLRSLNLGIGDKIGLDDLRSEGAYLLGYLEFLCLGGRLELGKIGLHFHG